MIKVNDIVRFTNEYLNGPGATWNYEKGYIKGKQKLMKVVGKNKGRWNWRAKKFWRTVVVFDGIKNRVIDVAWLRFVRRNRKNRMATRSLLR